MKTVQRNVGRQKIQLSDLENPITSDFSTDSCTALVTVAVIVIGVVFS